MCQPEHGHWTSPAHCVLHAVRSDSVTINQYQCSLLRWVYRYFLAAVIIHFLLRLLFSVKKVFRIVTFVLWFTLNIMTLTKLCRTNRDRIFINGIKIQQKMRIGTNKYEKEPWEWPNFYFFFWWWNTKKLFFWKSCTISLTIFWLSIWNMKIRKQI